MKFESTSKTADLPLLPIKEWIESNINWTSEVQYTVSVGKKCAWLCGGNVFFSLKTPQWIQDVSLVVFVLFWPVWFPVFICIRFPFCTCLHISTNVLKSTLLLLTSGDWWLRRPVINSLKSLIRVNVSHIDQIKLIPRFTSPLPQFFFLEFILWSNFFMSLQETVINFFL
jgi:hypothetical protein